MKPLRKRPADKTTEQAVAEVEEHVELPVNSTMLDMNTLISTGSTLLDLAISGGVKRGGGVPGGIIVEIYGPPSAGKSALLAEMGASVQAKGGSVKFLDPEARLNLEYCEIYGMSLEAESYSRPNTVNALFDEILNWKPKNPNALNMIAADSIAALSTEMEMESDDAMGMKRGKDFSKGTRKTCRMIANNNWLIVCANQERDSLQGGKTTPGGYAIPFHASLRIKVAPAYPASKITKTRTISGKKYEKTIGIHSVCTVTKSIVDDPFRTAGIDIVFGVGIDDIRTNLQWLKEATGASKYDCINMEYALMEPAIRYIEENNLEAQLRDKVIDRWLEVEAAFKQERKKKRRF
jgi:RecA/RadA recombinase